MVVVLVVHLCTAGQFSCVAGLLAGCVALLVASALVEEKSSWVVGEMLAITIRERYLHPI